MTFDTSLAAGVIVLYALGTLGILASTLSLHPSIKKAANLLTLAGFALHSLAAIMAFLPESIAELPFGFYMQMLAWCLVFLYIAAWRWLRYPFLGLTAAPLALLLYVLSLRFANENNILPEHLSGLFFGLHIWALYLSIGLLAMAFGSGLLFIYTESRLKKKAPLAEFTRDMPSLSTYDKVNSIAVIAGFPLYTLGLAAGFFWAPLPQNIVESPKVMFSLFVWFLYATLFYQRTVLQLKGRKTATMAIVIFAISALSAGIDYTMFHHSAQLLP